MRLRYEGKENADEITDKASVFFGKPAEFVRQQPNLSASSLSAGPHPRRLLLRSATSSSTSFFCRTRSFVLPAPPAVPWNSRAAVAQAMHRYNYYTCFQCAEPYFGGERDCGAAAGAPDG